MWFRMSVIVVFLDLVLKQHNKHGPEVIEGCYRIVHDELNQQASDCLLQVGSKDTVLTP